MNENKPLLVSVIVPVYNVKPYLNEALDSVINQTYTNLEIIVIDDGSTDGSGEICDEYAKQDNRIHVIHQTNQGLSAARNAGLDIMKGDLVAFLDSDDAFLPEMIETMVTAMEHSKVDLVICGYKEIKTEGKLAKKQKKKCRSDSEFLDRKAALCSLVEGKINFSVWNKLYKRYLWQNVRFPVGRICEDVAVMHLILDRTEQVLMIPNCLYLYRKRYGSITTKMDISFYQDWLVSYTDFFAYFDQNTKNLLSQKQSTRIRQKKISGLIAFYLRNNEAEVKKRIRGKVFELEREIPIQECKFRVRCAYLLLCYCPGLLKVIYPIYQAIHKIFLKLYRFSGINNSGFH